MIITRRITRADKARATVRMLAERRLIRITPGQRRAILRWGRR